MAAFPLSYKSGWITGKLLHVNGGIGVRYNVNLLTKLIINVSPRTLAFITITILTLSPVLAQEDYPSFSSQTINTTNAGMYTLGSWAIANMAVGVYGWSNNSGSSKYFHQMNFFWNTVNLSIAGFALYNNFHTNISELSPEYIMNRHLRIEKILLINAGLDAFYIGTGFLLRHLSLESSKNSALMKGYGNSLILQGGFLMVFDAVMYGILKTQRADFLHNLSVSFSPTTTQFHFNLPL